MIVPLIILWIIGIIFVVLICLYTFRGIRGWNQQNYVELVVGDKCRPQFQPPLIDFSDNQCCLVGGELTALRYDSNYDMVVSTVSVPYQEACAGFCTFGVTSQGQCKDGVGQTKYNQCIDSLKPKNCRGNSYPIGYIGTQYFYGVSATNSGCQTTRPCSNILTFS